jgi:hypothetical protein
VWGDDTGDHWGIWEFPTFEPKEDPDCDQEAPTLRGSDLPSAPASVLPVGKLSHSMALEAAEAGKSIVMCDRDATGSLYVRNACWIDDEWRLVMSHPTDRMGTINAPLDGVYELLFEDESNGPGEPPNMNAGPALPLWRLPVFAVPAIKTLWEESQIANDKDQSIICERALAGDEEAFLKCFDAINEAGNVMYNWQLSYLKTNFPVLTSRELKTDSAGYCRLIRQSMHTGQAVPTLRGDLVVAAPRQ